MGIEPHQLSLFYRYRPARHTPPSGQSPLLILLHGYGSNEEDLVSLSSYLDDRFALVCARAPHALGSGAYAWFAIEFMPTGVEADPEQAEESRVQLIDFVKETTAAYACDVEPSQVYLMGFSQGAAMSASVLLTHPELLGGAVLMSGNILPDLPVASADQLEDKPVIVVHGLYDDVIPVQQGRASRDLLQSLGLALTYREYPMGHQVTEESLEDIDAWLSDHIPSDAASD